VKNLITEIKSRVEGISTILEEVEEQITKLEDRVMESNQTEQEKRMIKKMRIG